MEARTDRSWVVAAFSWLLTVVGMLLVIAGLLYRAAGWKYGGVVAIWSAEWGLPLVGLGIGLARFGRRWAGAFAVGGGLGGIALVLFGEVTRAYDSYAVAEALGAVAILLGIASIIRHRRTKVSPSIPELQRTRSARR